MRHCCLSTHTTELHHILSGMEELVTSWAKVSVSMVACQGTNIQSWPSLSFLGDLLGDTARGAKGLLLFLLSGVIPGKLSLQRIELNWPCARQALCLLYYCSGSSSLSGPQASMTKTEGQHGKILLGCNLRTYNPSSPSLLLTYMTFGGSLITSTVPKYPSSTLLSSMDSLYFPHLTKGLAWKSAFLESLMNNPCMPLFDYKEKIHFFSVYLFVFVWDTWGYCQVRLSVFFFTP